MDDGTARGKLTGCCLFALHIKNVFAVISYVSEGTSTLQLFAFAFCWKNEFPGSVTCLLMFGIIKPRLRGHADVKLYTRRTPGCKRSLTISWEFEFAPDGIASNERCG